MWGQSLHPVGMNVEINANGTNRIGNLQIEHYKIIDFQDQECVFLSVAMALLETGDTTQVPIMRDLINS